MRYCNNEVGCIVDTETGDNYDGEEILELLNKQDDKIKEVEEMNHSLAQKLIRHLDKINKLTRYNLELTAQLQYTDSVCEICTHSYLQEKDQYYILKCIKGYSKASKEDIDYCEDFKLEGENDD